jgi:hypothetical protein
MEFHGILWKWGWWNSMEFMEFRQLTEFDGIRFWQGWSQQPDAKFEPATVKSLTFTVQRSNPNAPCTVGGKSTQCFIAYRRLQQITRWGSCDRVNWTCPSLKVWVENSPTLHGKGY